MAPSSAGMEEDSLERLSYSANGLTSVNVRPLALMGLGSLLEQVRQDVLVQRLGQVDRSPVVGGVVPDDLLLAGRLPEPAGHLRRDQLVAAGGHHQQIAFLEIGGT